MVVLCQPPDATALRDRGFVDVRPVEEALDWGALRVTRTNGRHGTGEIAQRMAPASGFVITTPDEPTLYLAGDTIWCDEVREAVDRHHPDIVVANAGGARFLEGDPITMTADDVVALARHPPAPGSSPSTSRRSTTAWRPGQTCAHALNTSSFKSASACPMTVTQ